MELKTKIMERKFKDDYQKKEITKRRFNELGFRYLQVWFYIFAVYLYLNEYLEDLSAIVINNKPLPIMELLIYSFMVAWLIPFAVVYFKDVNLGRVEGDMLIKIKKQKEKISIYKRQFKEGQPESTRYQRKLDKMKNKLTKFKTQLDMLGFDKQEN